MYFESLSVPKMLLVNRAQEMAVRLSPFGAVGAEKLQEKA